MKSFTFIILLILSSSINSLNAASEFWYDRDQLEYDFNELEIRANNQDTHLNTWSTPPDSTDFTIYDLELEPFCSGLCCGPAGLTILTRKDLTQSEKKSFWIGCGGFGLTAVLALTVLIVFESSFLFF